MIFFNDTDDFCCRTLRSAAHPEEAAVDSRNIRILYPDELAGYSQVHLFAGIGGWLAACRWAGIPDASEIWTGSCPCQPFSIVGRGNGTNDDRHLWPEMFRLIKGARPRRIAGEQVAGKAGLKWLGSVQADLESIGYRTEAVVLPAAGCGAPHVRERIFWFCFASDCRIDQRDADLYQAVSKRKNAQAHWLANSTGQRRKELGVLLREESKEESKASRCGEDDGWVLVPPEQAWRNKQWIECSDGMERPIESGTLPLAHGVPRKNMWNNAWVCGVESGSKAHGEKRKVGDILARAREFSRESLRAFGNAIVVPLATIFLQEALLMEEELKIKMQEDR